MHKFRWKKGLACGGLFLLLVGITLWLVLKDQNPAQLWTAVKQVRLPLLGAVSYTHLTLPTKLEV